VLANRRFSEGFKTLRENLRVVRVTGTGIKAMWMVNRKRQLKSCRGEKRILISVFQIIPRNGDVSAGVLTTTA
jgi:hypothetical protein